MKIQLITTALISLFILGCSENSVMDPGVTSAVKSFVKAGDERNLSSLQNILHPEFRAVVNRAFGSEEVSVMNKELYLNLMKDGTIGGDSRNVEILNSQIIGHNASVEAVFTGSDYKFKTFVLLAQNTDGNWKVINDMPFIEKMN